MHGMPSRPGKELGLKKRATKLQKIGFENIQIKPKPESRSFIRDWMPGCRIEEYVVSATIEAIKPLSEERH